MDDIFLFVLFCVCLLGLAWDVQDTQPSAQVTSNVIHDTIYLDRSVDTLNCYPNLIESKPAK